MPGDVVVPVSAARMGCRVALIQNRPVLGGNASSEVRVWANGGTRLGKYPHIGDIVEEFTDQLPVDGIDLLGADVQLAVEDAEIRDAEAARRLVKRAVDELREDALVIVA